MPVKKVHVKGKRKAPLPPTMRTTLASVPSSNPAENKATVNNDNNNYGENSCINDLQFSFSTNKRKKAAPLPPSHNNLSAVANDDHHNELNNFSMFSINNKFDDIANHHNNNNNNNNGSINLNIFEPIHNDLQNSTKQHSDVKRDQITETLNLTAQKNMENDQVWICDYCTLRNPFWKIVCDACERIKPYNAPNMPMSSALDVNYNKDIPQKIDNINVLAPVKIRTKTLNVNKGTENVLKRNSMRADLANNRNMQLVPRAQKMINRPVSMCFSPNERALNTSDSLELEKERIRSLIRAMNNRAMAKNVRTEAEQPLNDNPMANGGAIKKYCKFQDQNKLKHSARYDAANDYNFPVKEKKVYDIYLSQTDDSKASLNSASKMKATSDIRHSSNLFDQTIFENLRRIPEPRINTDGDLVPSSAGSSNKLKINVYVNFNKAVEIKVDHRMTLDEFEKIVSKNMAPSRCPKIYFNGLLLRDGNLRLVSYGVKDRSSLYINTENIVAHTRNDVTSPIKYLNEKPKEMPIAGERIKLDETKDVTKPESKYNVTKSNTKTAGEKYLIEHIQYDRFLVEKINPEPLNLSKTKYRGVYNYNPRCNPDLVHILNDKCDTPKKPIIIKPETVIQNVHESCEPAITASMCDSVNQYMELLSLDERMDLTKNTEIFECSICLVDYQPLEGIMLRNCLHTFCKDCVRNSIIYSDGAEVKCPYIDKEYSCEYNLQDREIKALLSNTEYDEHLAKSLRIAENQIENSFHCRTPNCKGWCIFEDDVNVFKCPICSLGNCLTCRVIHDGLDCKQYQTMMQNNIDGNPENATTVKLLEEMISSGDAMKCPTCKIVLMKKWGCDWLKCSMCKTEICWITRGPRWGPAGKGDTSAGCRCGVDGFRCHPKCTYCH